MKIAHINMLPNGSTGKIMFGISKSAVAEGHICRTYTPVLYARGKKFVSCKTADHYEWGSRMEGFFHYYLGTIFGMNGMFSHFGTRQLLKDLDAFKPDIIHLHNLHNFTINLPMLFKYIKRKKIKTVWTLHDCWSFTGHCPHFEMIKCDKWKTECYKCPQKSVYPKTYLDTTKSMYRKKKNLFSGIDNLTIVTPSKWLASLVKQSFLNQYDVRVINNGIDLSVFKPRRSDFKKKYGCEDKTVLLGVAYGWGERKGLDVFLELSKRLDEKYQIVLVGTNSNIDKSLPQNIISINRTENQKELAEIYTAADLFVNPTREDTYPTVNIEALACGTPVLTFETGGSPEIPDNKCGFVVGKDDITSMLDKIVMICEESPFKRDDCVARASSFDMYDRYKDYVELYREIS